MRSLRVGVIGSFCAFCAIAGEAHAAEAPDLVRLKNGGMLRGTISEYVPGDHVSITLANGEERRVAGDEVEFAGPAPAGIPEPPAPQDDRRDVASPDRYPPRVIARVKEHLVPVQLVQEDAAKARHPITFHVRTGSQTADVGGFITGRHGGFYAGNVTADSFEQLCTAPCAAELQRGTHKIALAVGDGRPVSARQVVTLDGPATLSGRYKSFAGMRAIGWVTFAAGLVAISVSPLVALNGCGSTQTSCDAYDTDTFIVMIAGGTVGALAGLFMGLKKDEARVTVHPGVRAAGAGRGGVGHEPSFRGVPVGLTGAFSF